MRRRSVSRFRPPTGEAEDDLAVLQAYYAGKRGRSDGAGEIRFRR
jgi:hypothetical protein